QVIKRLSQANKTAVLISSHMIHDIEALTSKVCIVHKGEWVETESADQILSQYPSLEAYYLKTVQGRKAV
ncbi:MAG: ABC transporter ATP-binding protein, partial [Vallitaleaceae bacterium]|nr:ABC transporter ATP-binding protein [Vallitaleaceae bacterium]